MWRASTRLSRWQADVMTSWMQIRRLRPRSTSGVAPEPSRTVLRQRWWMRTRSGNVTRRAAFEGAVASEVVIASVRPGWPIMALRQPAPRKRACTAESLPVKRRAGSVRTELRAKVARAFIRPQLVIYLRAHGADRRVVSQVQEPPETSGGGALV